MSLFRKHKPKALWIGLLVATMLVFGCAGIEPYEPRDNREEGPERGLFTGLEGEFVIFRKSDEPDSGSEAHKCSDETVDGEQQKMGGKEKNAENKNGEEQP